MEQTIKIWALDLIRQRQLLRNWKNLPDDFQYEAVKLAFQEIKPHFDKKDIRLRIMASKSTTFDELIEAIERS